MCVERICLMGTIHVGEKLRNYKVKFNSLGGA
uniref:Uncharacterized protein n=1 Tax=Arundo donax TaxID=35708 RepID=A0A0A9F879_ARUDO